MAAVWATNYFKYYVFGREFQICSDHKPLEDIAKKDISKMPNCLQRMMLQLQGYQYTIKYVSAQNVPIADCLSRCVPTDREPKAIPYIDVQVHDITNMKPFVIDRIRAATASDTILQSLKATLLKGGLQKKKSL